MTDNLFRLLGVELKIRFSQQQENKQWPSEIPEKPQMIKLLITNLT